MEHRGACGCEQNTGDGAGILIQVPHWFLSDECRKSGVELPQAGEYAVGSVFLPVDVTEREVCERVFEEVTRGEGLEVLGWRSVPTNDSLLGHTARASQPFIRQVFIARGSDLVDDAAFERKLYVIRRCVTKAIRNSGLIQQTMFYVASLSHRTLIYKGMLTASQLAFFYPDLLSKSLESCLAVVHSRFSTNTFPSWARAHPYRYIAHNGEINTLRGNVNWMRARESKFASNSFGEDLSKIMPVIDSDTSDSGMFDNVLEMLTLAGRSLPHALMMMIPEAWSGDTSMSAEKRAFYEYHSCLMEPWDGPAAVTFTDGIRVGAVLDRNGLRPARYYVTSDDLVVLASEVGVLDLPASKIVAKGRLQPGRMFLVDTEQGRIIGDEELKHELAIQHPYKDWLDSNIISLEQLPDAPFVHKANRATLRLRQKAFGFTYEDLKILIKPMATTGHEAIGSMGTDTPLAVLSNRSQLLFNYFKQLFAQVTNPPVDAIREELIMSAHTTIGPEANLLEPSPECCHQIRLPSPILSNEELEKVRLLGDSDGPWGAHGFKTITLSTLFKVDEGGEGLADAMEDLCHQASAAISAGYQIIILSDRNIDERMAAIPCLLAVAGVHHHLIREGTRTQVGLLVETGEAREVHHFSLLVSYGAAAVNPYLVFETIDEMAQDGGLQKIDPVVARSNFVSAIKKGIVKVISKMGISTTQSYCGAQVFEALGLNQKLIDKYFTGTNSPIGGIDLDIIAEEVRSRHETAFTAQSNNTLTSGGEYQYRSDGERHLFSPATIHKLQQACRLGDYELFKQYSALVNDHSKGDCTLRGRLELRSVRPPIDLDEVESIESILRRFKTGAMSYGSISKEAHEALAVAMNRLGGKSNTGEGGEDPARYESDGDGDSRNSAIKQVASGRFGVTSNYLVHAQEIQIKIAQGAKPGEGGQLAGTKVYPWIASVRLTTAGVGLISPPPHHDIYSIEDLSQLISDLKNANPRARISVKLVAEGGVGTIAAGVAKAKADVILISGYDGGTGAAPLTSIKHTGVPWELGLAETHQTLLLNNLRSRVRLETDGQLKTGRDVVIAALLGAEEFGFATAPLVTLGCIMMRACHLNTCPVGVATQDPKLRARFTGDPDHLVNFMQFIGREVRELMAQLGFRHLDEMVGKVECLEMLDSDHWKGKSIDLSRVLFKPDISPAVGEFQQVLQDHALEDTLDSTRLLSICQPALKRRQAVSADLKIRNTDRAVGTMLGSELTRQYGPAGLPHDTIQLNFLGSAGQSFGAFLPKGITFRLNGDANDYVGKGLSGGKLIVFPPKAAGFRAEDNVIIGNVAFYGATSGEAYIHGLAGERFCVRNSGANVVVHEIGDHGCEYMTGGHVIVLSKTGRNFGAGMSGGIAYVVDEFKQLSQRCNHELISLGPVEEPEELDFIKNMIFRHAEYTGSERAAQILLSWDEFVPSIVRVLPNDYGRVIDARKKVAGASLNESEAALAVFEMTRSAGQ